MVLTPAFSVIPSDDIYSEAEGPNIRLAIPGTRLFPGETKRATAVRLVTGENQVLPGEYLVPLPNCMFYAEAIPEYNHGLSLDRVETCP